MQEPQYFFTPFEPFDGALIDHDTLGLKMAAIPRGMPIVVTADHGYIFFGSSLESIRDSDAASLLGQARSKEFAATETLPAWHPDLQIVPTTRTAMLRGRLRAKPQGPASRKIYQHGGFSLMEALVPWIELERE